MVTDCEGDQKNSFLSYILYLGVKRIQCCQNIQVFYFGIYNKYVFIDKINTIKIEFPLLEACLLVYLFVDIDIIIPTPIFLNKTTCVLDPFPTKLLMSHLSSILDIILCIVNLCFPSGGFQTPCKSSIIFPLIKKQGLDPEILKNYSHVTNLSFIFYILKNLLQPKYMII